MYYIDMAKGRLSGFLSGPKGLRRIWQSNNTLRRLLGKKEKDYALKSLMTYREGGGITAEPGGIGYQSEVEKAVSRWRRDRKDPIDDTEAKIIKRELEKYAAGNKAKASSLDRLRSNLNTETERKYSGRQRDVGVDNGLGRGGGHDYLDALRGPDEGGDNDSRLGESPHRFDPD